MQTAIKSCTGELEPIFVSVKTACRLIGLGPTKLYELLNVGAIDSIKVGGKRLVVYRSLKRLLGNIEAAAPK